MNEARPLARLRHRFQQWARRFGVASADIEDLVQEALEIVWAKGAHVDPARTPESWELTILLNQARKYHRRRQLRREVLTPFDEREDAHDAGQNPEDSTLFRARLAVLQALIAQIDEARHDIFVEHHLLDLSITEIASKHAIPEETVRTRLKRAWEEIDAARSRWQAEQRRRGGDILPAFFLPMGWRQGFTMVRDSRAKVLRLTTSAALVAGLIALSAPSPPPPPVSALIRWPSAQLVPPAPDRDPEPEASPKEAGSGTPDAPVRIASGPPSGDTTDSPLEDSLIGRARVAIKTGQTGLARRLLADHARLFPVGRRASEREALLHTLR